MGLAKIPGHAGSSQHWPGESPVERLVGGRGADIDQPLLEDAIIGEEILDIVEKLGEPLGPSQDIVEEPRRQVLVHAARPIVCRVHARAADPLIEFHQQFAFLETPEERRHRADVGRIGGHHQ